DMKERMSLVQEPRKDDLPVSEGAPTSAESDATAPSPETLCILLVDDERSVRRVAEKALSRAGFSVLVAESGEEALRIYEAKAGQIGLVVLDMAVPGMDGRDTFVA